MGDRRLQISRLSALCVLATVTAAILSACYSQTAVQFRGTELTPSNPATLFEFQNQFGENVALSDFDDKVVLLTFVYTNCTDVCPITASQLRDTYDKLGGEASDVAIVAISVDPARDTIDAALEFSERWKMADSWSYLIGTEEELAPIWEAYYIDPAIVDRSEETVPVAHEPEITTPHQSAGVDGLRQEILNQYLVIHSSPVFLIDREGAMRALFTLPFNTDDLVHDVRLLLG